MKILLMKIFIVILRIIYAPMKLLKTKRKVVYISRQFNNGTLDFNLIVNEMKNRYCDMENVVLTKRLEKGIFNEVKYFFHMIRQMYHIATAKVVIIDSYCIVVSVLKHKKRTKVIQIWHAISAIKKFGYQTIGKSTGADSKIAKTMRMHKNYDYVLCSSKTTMKNFLEAFNVKEEIIKYIPLPRLDYILKKDSQIEEIIYDEYPILKEKINILYVPTFRKFKKVKVNELVERIDTKKYNLIVKLHPLDKKNYTYKQKDGVIYDDKFKTYDFLKICDKIITDYSSLAMEASVLMKPIYFYIYDLNTYKIDPGLNFDFEKEEIGKYATRKTDELIKIMEQEYDYSILERFQKKYISVCYDDCTYKIVNFIMELVNDEEENKTSANEFSKEELNV